MKNNIDNILLNASYNEDTDSCSFEYLRNDDSHDIVTIKDVLKNITSEEIELIMNCLK